MKTLLQNILIKQMVEPEELFVCFRKYTLCLIEIHFQERRTGSILWEENTGNSLITFYI